jgi:hypothetical protein
MIGGITIENVGQRKNAGDLFDTFGTAIFDCLPKEPPEYVRCFHV